MNWIILLALYIYSIKNCVSLTGDPIGLGVSASLRGILLGTAVRIISLKKNIDEGQYVSNIKKNYKLIVPEHELKPKHIWRGDNRYDFADVDWLIGGTPNSTGWIQQNGMQLRGHTLVWSGDRYTPEWLLEQESSITPGRAISLLSSYIHTVVGRYRGKIVSWDVVNEVFEDFFDNGQPFNLRDCFWYRKIGVDYIKYAFIFARQADPNAQLYYSDTRIEWIGEKSNKTVELIKRLKSEGAPIDGIGMHWHTNASVVLTPGDTYYQNAQQFIDQGLDLIISELDVSIEMNGTKYLDPAAFENQATVYRSLLQYAFHFFPKCPEIVTWGFTDRHSWIPKRHNYTKGDALPFDVSYQPKPAYWKMQEELARVVTDGIFCLSPQSQPHKYLGISENTTSNHVQVLSGQCNNANEKWNITWLHDGTYRLSSLYAKNRVLAALNATAIVGEVQMQDWSDDDSQEWVFTMQKSNTYRIGPRRAWTRVMTVDQMNNITIFDDVSGNQQYWILRPCTGKMNIHENDRSFDL